MMIFVTPSKKSGLQVRVMAHNIPFPWVAGDSFLSALDVRTAE
jgi:hypothetical protein